MLVTQACGLDLFVSSAPIEPLAAPVFDLDCGAANYYSFIVGDLHGSVAAVNSLSSRSGWSALLTRCRPERVVVTGSHQGSLAALRSGQADVAAIDAVTWNIIARDAPSELEGIAIVERSGEAPAPPYVVREGTECGDVLRSLQSALQAREATSARRALLLREVVPVARKDYLPVLNEYRNVSLRAVTCVEGTSRPGASC